MKQNCRFIQQFPVEKNNQQNYTEILNMTIFTNNLYSDFFYFDTSLRFERTPQYSVALASQKKLKLKK